MAQKTNVLILFLFHEWVGGAVGGAVGGESGAHGHVCTYLTARSVVFRVGRAVMVCLALMARSAWTYGSKCMDLWL